MNGWLKIKPEEFINERKESIQGVRVTVATSPYDLPTAVRGGFAEGAPYFLIEFKYRNEEATRREPYDNDVFLEVGVGTGRLHKILINLERFQAKTVALKFESVIDDAISNLEKTHNRLDNYQVTQKIIHQKREQLLEFLQSPDYAI